MSLFIKDPKVDAMAERLRAVTKAASKTDAVRAALSRALEEAERRQPILERLAPALALAQKIGPGIGAGAFDQKAFFDALGGGL
jgi:antitoxin VapB